MITTVSYKPNYRTRQTLHEEHLGIVGVVERSAPIGNWA